MTAIPPTALIDPSEGDTRAPRRLTRAEKRAIAVKGRLSSPWASGIAIVLAVLWTVPTFGLLVTSFRPRAEIRSSGWWTFLQNPEVTLDNYREVLFGSSTSFATFFVNSLVITLPAVVIPIALALLAAYAFAWIDFRFREVLFVAVFALQVVPIQVTLIPLLSQYVSWGLNGSFWVVWLSHSIFALPLAIYLLHNFMKDIPASLVEAARVDGAGHVTVFFRVLLPLLTPIMTAFQWHPVWFGVMLTMNLAIGQFTPPMAVNLMVTTRVAGISMESTVRWVLWMVAAMLAALVLVTFVPELALWLPRRLGYL